MRCTSVVIADRHPVVLQGLSNKEIGRQLNITDGTIKQHLHHIYQKLEISNRTVLAVFVLLQMI